MHQARLRGTYYEMGYQQGKMMKRGVLPPIWSESFHENADPTRREFADACEDIVRQHMPDFLDELHGVADAVSADYQRIKIWPLCSYAKLQQSCSAVAISGEHTAQGKPLFIRNYDYLDADGKDFTAFWTKPKNGYSSLGFSDAMSSRYCGFNEKGLAVASSISGYAGPTQPGVAFSLATRWVLDHHSTTAEAAKFFRKVPHFHGWTFLLSDVNGNIVRVETCPERVELVGFEGIGVSTNHYLSKEMQEYEDKNWRSEGSTVGRYANILNWFRSRNGPITTDYACKLAKSRVGAGGICDRFVGVEGGTLWSWIHVIGEPNVLISDGPPSEHTYKKIHAL
ncbi:MAG: C45 family autoproteolytic acyltransferase/hydrolase [Promethearchaeota archaeon]